MKFKSILSLLRESIFMFKKITAVLIFMIAVCALLGISYFNRDYVLFGIGENHAIYLENSSNNVTPLNSTKILSKVKSETCVVKEDNFILEDFLIKFNAKIVMVEDYGEGICYYAFSPEIKYIENVCGKNVNLHIAFRKDSVKIGAPLIYGSF